MDAPRGPRTRQVIAAAEETNARLGHEALGALSTCRGFVPRYAPRRSFPASHAAWDQAAAELPRLYRELTVRAVLDAMPVLPAGAASLPDADLPRAATVLGVLGHAWVHGTADGRTDLPDSVARPWAQVRRRLGRSTDPVLSYADLIVHNWRTVDDEAAWPFRLGDLRLLVPAVDNQEEQVFYLTQLEILVRCAPVLAQVAAAQDAVLDDEPQALRDALDGVTGVLRTTSRRSLSAIDPRPRSATHVDPVVWAKTVAPFAVPLRPGVLGPSGTASPLFNLLDSFLGRSSHSSQLGREILLHRQSYPPHWRRLLDAVDRVSVADHVAARGRRDLTASLAAAREAYAGDDGFLGRHRRKVYGYLSVAFTVGRAVTIGGFAGTPRAHAWTEVDAALRRSQAERPGVPSPSPDRPRGPAVTRPGSAAPVRDRLLSVADLALHNDDRHGWWTAIDGCVHDVTGLLDHHPGGRAVLRAHAGLEASDAFRRAHAGRPGVERLLRSTEIGRLTRPAGTCPAHPAWVRALDAVVELQNTYRLDRSLGEGTDLCAAGARRASPFQTDRAADTHARFVDGYLPQVAVELLLPLAAGAPVPPPRRPPAGASGGCWRDRMDALDRRIATVKRLVCAGVRRCEAGPGADRGEPELSRIGRRAVAVCLDTASTAEGAA